MNDLHEDVPPGVDFLVPEAAQKWATEAEEKLSSRIPFFTAFVEALQSHTSKVQAVLELGSGPGFLAEHVLSRCESIARYELLDFSPTMLDLSRQRLQAFGPRVSFVRGNFKDEGWARRLGTPCDAILSIQAVHELRHKRHAVKFYKECFALLNSGGLLVICDRLPQGDSERDRALFMTSEEQITAIRQAGFNEALVVFQSAERVVCKALN